MPVVVTRRPPLVAAVLALVIGTFGCNDAGQPTHTSATSAATTGQRSAVESAPADAAVSSFHEQLVINGEDIQSDFGGDVLALGLNPRDLQQDTPEHAYQTVLQKVRDVQDPKQRREMTRTLFGTESPR